MLLYELDYKLATIDVCVARTRQASESVAIFFSSRRRQTRCLSDWSSDVCSSDLAEGLLHGKLHVMAGNALVIGNRFVVDGGAVRVVGDGHDHAPRPLAVGRARDVVRRRRFRSEERRVGKEGRSGW